MRTNQLSEVFIQGMSVALEGLQQRLYQKYAEKYGLTK